MSSVLKPASRARFGREESIRGRQLHIERSRGRLLHNRQRRAAVLHFGCHVDDRSLRHVFKPLGDAAMTGNDILRMVKRRVKAAGLPARRPTCYSFRATTITARRNGLEAHSTGVAFEDVQFLAGHSDPRTTRLDDRRKRSNNMLTRNTATACHPPGGGAGRLRYKIVGAQWC